MQQVGNSLLQITRARTRDMICVYEFYDPSYDASAGFNPVDAKQLFSSEIFTLPYGPLPYRREVIEGPAISKTRGKEANSASLQFSNVSRYVAGWVQATRIEGMRLVVRLISRSVAQSVGNNVAILGQTAVLFVGRCNKPDGFDRGRGTISANPDLGTTEAQIPPYIFQPSCPLEFKGEQCMGGETLAEKTLAFQQAVTCNFTFAQCSQYGNTKKFQGIRVIPIESSFIHKSHKSFWGKIGTIASLGLLGRRQKITVNNSTHDGTPYGNPIPIILGRWLKALLPLQFQDIGTSINFLMAACRGPISDFINIRNDTPGFTAPIGVTKHLGEYGGIGTQTQDTVFPEHGFFSRLAYITGYCNGTAIEVEDPAPAIAALVAGVIAEEIYFDVDHNGTGKLSAGTGGVSASGGRTGSVQAPADSFDDAILEIGSPEFYFKTQETAAGNVFPIPSGGMIDSSGNENHAWYIDAANGGPPTFDISTPEVPIETDPGSRFVSGPVGFLPAPSGGSLDPRGNQTWIAVARITSHVPQSYIFNRGSDSSGGVAFGLSFGNGLGSDIVVANWGNGAIQEPGEGDGQLTSGPIPQDGTPILIVTVREGSTIKLYLQGCLVDEDFFPAGDIVFEDFNESPWRFGYTPNLVFGPVWQSQGLSHCAMFNGVAATPEQVSRLWASMRTDPTGCPVPDWTDNPVDHTRYILTDPGLLNNQDIDDFQSAYAAAYCCGAIKDDTNGERLLLPNTENGNAGVSYKRYNSSGLLGPQSFDPERTQIPAGVPDREAEYEFYDPAEPPEALELKTVYRKRFTCNIEVADPKKVLDFLYDTLFPTFRGFLRWNVKGQTVIDNERPADNTDLRSAATPEDEQILVRDAMPWKSLLGSPYLLEGKICIGEGQISEVRAVESAAYSADGDSISLAASASGGPSATASGATLSGGSPTVRSSGTVTIGGSLSDGASITVTIDGVDCVLDLVKGESSATIGYRMAAVINAEPLLQRYIEAQASANVVTIYCKYGVLTLSSALEQDHPMELANPTTAPTGTIVGSGTLGAGVYLVGYAYRNANGTTLVSDLRPFTLSANQKIDIDGLTPPAGVDSVDWYLSRSADDPALGLLENNDGSAFTINALPAADSPEEPQFNLSGTEVTRVMMSFAGKAATWADTTAANILDGSFNWPGGSKQAIINQVRGKYREAIRDFGEQPITVNDFPHQRATKKTSRFDVDIAATDSYNQAARLMNGLLNKLREGDKFYSWGSAGEALFLDEGDVVCVSDDSGNPPYRNLLVRIEEVNISARLEVELVARLYSKLQYNDLVALPQETQLTSGGLAAFQQPPPNISFNTEDFPPYGLAQATEGGAGITSIRGGAIFGSSIYAQYATVRLIIRGGVSTNEQVTVIRPDANGEALFEFVASTDGLYRVELEVCNQWGCNKTKPTADIIIGFGTTFGISKQGGSALFLKEGGVFIEKEHA